MTVVSVGRSFVTHAGGGDSSTAKCSAASVMTIQPYIVVKQVGTAPLPNARQQMRVSRVLADDHYKRMPRVTVGVAR